MPYNKLIAKKFMLGMIAKILRTPIIGQHSPNKLILSNIQVNGEIGVVKKKNDATKAITCKEKVSTQKGLCSQSIKIRDNENK
jgi:hypothetical protein